MSEQGTQNQALEQTRDSVLRHCEPVGRELLNLIVIAPDLEMPNSAAKVSSAYLTSDAMRSFLAALPSVMREIYGDRPLVVFYGAGCRLHMDLCFKPMQWPLHLFKDFLTESLGQQIFEFGQADLLIESPDSNLQIVICHELDIHLDGTDDRAIGIIMAGFPDLDFHTAADWKTRPPQNVSPVRTCRDKHTLDQTADRVQR